MTVQKENFSDHEGTIRLTNGDFQALKKITEEYHLADESDVIAFAIGVLSRAGGKPISVEQADGTTAKLFPADKLRKSA